MTFGSNDAIWIASCYAVFDIVRKASFLNCIIELEDCPENLKFLKKFLRKRNALRKRGPQNSVSGRTMLI